MSKVSIRKNAGTPWIKRPLLRLNHSPNSPVVADRWLDVAYIALWFVYGLWGVSVFILGLPTIVQFAPEWYQAVWSGVIGCLAITAAILASLVFFDTGWISQITKKRWERFVVIALCAFIGIYPVLLVIRVLLGDFVTAGAAAVLSFSYVIFPILRLHLLKKRINAIREVGAIATGTNKTV